MSRIPPALATEVPGNFWTSALWGTVQQAVGFLTAVPMFYGYQTTTQSIANNTYASFTLDTEVFDPDGGHSPTVNPSRYTPQVPGTYLFIGASAWTGNAVGTRRTRITVDGVTIKGGGGGYDVNQTTNSGGLAIALAAMNGSTDFAEVQGNQTSGGALSTVSNAELACSLIALWVSS